MSSTQISTRRLTAVLATGALGLLTLTAQAQVVYTSPATQRDAAAPGAKQTGASSTVAPRRVASGQATPGRANSVTQSSRVVSATSGSAANGRSAVLNASNPTYTGGATSIDNTTLFAANLLNNYSYPDFGGAGLFTGQSFFSGFGGNGFGGFGANNGFNGLGGNNVFGGAQTGSVAVIGSPFYGGNTTFGPSAGFPEQNSGFFTTVIPNPGVVVLDALGPYGNNGANYNNVGSSGPDSGSIQNAPARPAAPSLAQSLTVRRGRNYDVSLSWRGDPAQISGMNVTLLDRLHLPVAQQSAQAGSAAYFPANRDTFAARYYRVDVQYADGTTGSLTAPLQR